MEYKEFVKKVAENFKISEDSLVPCRVSEDDEDILGIVYFDNTKTNKRIYVGTTSYKNMKKGIEEYKIGDFYASVID